MANGDSIGDPVCRHGRPECTCLDNQIPPSGWVQASTTFTNTWVNANPNGVVVPGTSTPIIQTPTIIQQPTTWSNFQFAQPSDETEVEDECRDGHFIDAKTIRYISGGEDEDEIIGRCLFCECDIYIPRVVGGLSFEKAGAAIGRAMTLDDGDEKIGALLADLKKLEREANAEITRYKRALGMIEIARDLAELRAISGPSA